MMLLTASDSDQCDRLFYSSADPGGGRGCPSGESDRRGRTGWTIHNGVP